MREVCFTNEDTTTFSVNVTGRKIFEHKNKEEICKTQFAAILIF